MGHKREASPGTLDGMVTRGKKVKKGEDVANWLKNKPKEADVDIHFFAILDKTAEKGLMVVGRQGGLDLKNMDNLEFMRHDAEFATSSLFAAQFGTWEEIRAIFGNP